MKLFLAQCLIGLSTIGVLALPAHAAPAAEEIYLGSVAMDVPAAMVQRLTPQGATAMPDVALRVR